ncbi:MAG: hypothetical protein KDB37_16890 [Ilumatobacter sp.]|nr:hypothetical protein [Ilumatobacter sp.]
MLAQFCFDSEQAYVFNQVTNVLTDPTPEQAEASLSILAFTIDAAAASAPEGMAEQPQRASEIMGELIPVFEEYAYDVDAISESGALEPMAESFAEFDSIMTQLADFVDAECTPARAVLDSQAIKLAPVIDQLRDWPLQPIANQAGDIRLLVSADWPEWIGSTEVEAVTLLQASNDLDEFDATWNVPGVAATVGYVEPGTADLAILFETSLAAPDCTLDSSEDYVDDVYYGQLYLLSECGGVDTDAAVLAVTDGATESVEVSLEFQFPGGYDRALLDQMLATFAAGA